MKQGSLKSNRVVGKKPSTDSIRSVRYRLSIAIFCLVAVITIISVFETSASETLKQLMPLLMLIVGYYFAKR